MFVMKGILNKGAGEITVLANLRLKLTGTVAIPLRYSDCTVSGSQLNCPLKISSLPLSHHLRLKKRMVQEKGYCATGKSELKQNVACKTSD